MVVVEADARPQFDGAQSVFVQVVGVDITRVHIANIEVSIVRVSIDATFSDMPYFIIFFSSILLYILICHQFWLKILYIFLNL